MSLHRVVALAVAVAVLAMATQASAWCRTSTEKLADGCRPHADNCCSLGKPIYWPNRCIGFSMQHDGTHKLPIPYLEARTTLLEAFRIWTSVSCPDGEVSTRVSIDARELPPVDCADIGTPKGVANQNAIIFRDSVWAHDDPDNVLALTSVTFDKDTGVINGADLEFNSANFALECAAHEDAGVNATCFDGPARSKGASGEKVYDFASVATHEVGHFFGMGHSNRPDATMTAQYPENAVSLRTLTADDIAGICAAYPADGTRRTGPGPTDWVKAAPCDPTPSGGFATDCQQKKCGVSAVGAAAGKGGETGALASLVTLLVLARIRTWRRTFPKVD